MADNRSSISSKTVFEQIEQALGATAPGRAFLLEIGRRARGQETALLLDAVARLERRARAQNEDVDREEIASLIGQIETALRDAKLAFRGSMTPPREPRLAAPPDVASFGRETTGAVRAAVEIVQETAWKMREAGFDAELCDRLDDQTSAIYLACTRQDRMLDGLATIERAIGRADAFVGELRRTVAPVPAAAALPLVSGAPATLLDGDIEFVPALDAEDPESGRG